MFHHDLAFGTRHRQLRIPPSARSRRLPRLSGWTGGDGFGDDVVVLFDVVDVSVRIAFVVDAPHCHPSCDDSITLVLGAGGGSPRAMPSFSMSPWFCRCELMSSSSPGGLTGGIDGGNDSIALVGGGGVSLRDAIILNDSLLRPGAGGSKCRRHLLGVRLAASTEAMTATTACLLRCGGGLLARRQYSRCFHCLAGGS